jgi:hypothetical protein
MTSPLVMTPVAFAAADLWVFHEVDPQILLVREGFEIGAARQILFFPPALMARLLATDPPPRIEWSDPSATFVRYGNEGSAQLGHNLVEASDRIVGGLPDG